MNLDKLMAWVVAVVLLCAATGNLDHLQKWVWKAQAKAIYDSRSSTWVVRDSSGMSLLLQE